MDGKFAPRQIMEKYHEKEKGQEKPYKRVPYQEVCMGQGDV